MLKHYLMINLKAKAMPAQTITQTFFRNRYRVLLFGFGIALLTFLGLYLTTTPQWEARGAIRLGRVPILGVADVRVEMTPVMLTPVMLTPVVPATAVMEILKQPSFLQDVVKAEANGFASVQEPLRVRMLPSGHIEVKARAPSRERAAQYLDGIMKNLKLSHDKLFERRVSVVKGELQRIDRQLAANQVIQGRSIALLDNALRSTPSLPDLLLLNILTQQSERIDRLTDYKVRLEDSVAPLNNFPTDFFGKIEVSDEPVSPNKLIYAILSFFVGLFTAIAIVLTMYLKERGPALGAKN